MESEADEENQATKNVEEILPVEYQEYGDEYETVTINPQQTYSTIVRGKYYKQTYRTAWEHMPDFKGWLTGVQGEPTRAYCLYCRKTLHAHRLSLLKHTCTIRHQKAAQLHNTRKNKNQNMDSQIIYEGQASNQEEPEGDEEGMVEYSTVEIEEGEQQQDAEQEHEDGEDEEEEEETMTLETLPAHFQKQIRSQIVPMSLLKPPISTHVLDTSKGHPVSGLQVSLYKLIDGRWTYINEGITNPDGRFANFLERGDFSTGRYKLHYDVDRYFELRKQDSLYPFIEIVFDCRSQSDHYHVPLLLSAYGYTTYRGT